MSDDKDGRKGSKNNFRVVTLPAPTERERSQMYAQRYMAHYPRRVRSSSSTGAGTIVRASNG
jgi:Polyphosphate kinase 2 (PPK2)